MENKIYNKNIRVAFGLKQQRLVTTVGIMLANGKTWEEIGSKIGWCPKTAKEHWISIMNTFDEIKI